nr:hypothetical protein [Candidatus Sigynarchaeota archaeon]
MAAPNQQGTLPEARLNELCEMLGLKPTKKNRILVARLVKNVGEDKMNLEIALKKAQLGS